MFDISIYEIINIILFLISILIIFVASLKVFRSNEIPKSKLLLVAFIGTVTGVFLPLIETFYIIEDSELFSFLVDIYLGIMFVVGSYGFWCLVQYATNINANKAIKKDV